MNVVIDNDVIYKGIGYGILVDIVQIYCDAAGSVGVLGAARFVIAKKVQKGNLRRNAESVLQDLASFLSGAVELEPTDNEQHLAADLESAAQQLGVNLDAGESQLCAIVIERGVPVILTGDKRAITAIERLLDQRMWLQILCGKVRCLEQAVLCVLDQKDFGTLRGAICTEPMLDKTLTICFGCNSPEMQRDTVLRGLDSYIRALRSADAVRVLAS